MTERASQDQFTVRRHASQYRTSMMRRSTLLCTLALAVFASACGSEEDHPGHGEEPDAGEITVPDGAAASGPVVQVDCAGATVAVTVTTPGFRYEPAEATISAGQIVRFDPASGHDVASDTAGLFNVPFAGDRCFRFEQPGTFKYHCSPHDFRGTIVVQ
jgi:plastocyanin